MNDKPIILTEKVWDESIKNLTSGNLQFDFVSTERPTHVVATVSCTISCVSVAELLDDDDDDDDDHDAPNSVTYRKRMMRCWSTALE